MKVNKLVIFVIIMSVIFASSYAFIVKKQGLTQLDFRQMGSI